MGQENKSKRTSKPITESDRSYYIASLQSEIHSLATLSKDFRKGKYQPVLITTLIGEKLKKSLMYFDFGQRVLSAHTTANDRQSYAEHEQHLQQAMVNYHVQCRQSGEEVTSDLLDELLLLRAALRPLRDHINDESPKSPYTDALLNYTRHFIGLMDDACYALQGFALAAEGITHETFNCSK